MQLVPSPQDLHPYIQSVHFPLLIYVPSTHINATIPVFEQIVALVTLQGQHAPAPLKYELYLFSLATAFQK